MYFNNVIIVEFEAFNLKEKQRQLWKVRMVTKDGNHFVMSMGEIIKKYV